MITTKLPAEVNCVVEVNSSPTKIAIDVCGPRSLEDTRAEKKAPWKKLELDTRLLGVETAVALSSLTSQGLKEAIDECAAAGVDLLYWTPEPACPANRDEGDLMKSQPWFTGYAVANAVLFRQAVPMNAQSAAESAGSFSVSSVPPTDNPEEELIKLGLVSGENSRFRRDPALTRAQFEAMYRAWVRNSINRTAADDVLVCRKNGGGEIAGMITLKFVNEKRHGMDVSRSNKENSDERSGAKAPPPTAVIGLLAVSPKFQRQGIGRFLMQAAFERSEQVGARAIEVSTQEENVGAMRFYAAQGFEQVSRKTNYHIWIPTSLLGRDSKVRFNVPYFTGRESLALNDVIANKTLDSLGNYTRRCQEWMEQTLGSPQALLTHSATAALEQAAILCELKEGDEVIMPSYTFVSTANAVVLRGAVPVFVDVVPEDITIDASAIEAAVTEKTKAIIVVHYAGMPCDMDPIMALAKRHGLYVIEDAAQALLSKYKGRYLGTIGHFGCFSFHYTKNTVCGEGGALLVNDEEFLVQSRIVREKGTNRSDFMDNKVAKYEWLSIGSSFEPSELSAAFLLPQLEDASECRERRLRVCSAYQSLLAPLEKAGKLTLARVASSEDVESASSGNGHIFWLMFKLPSERQAAEAWMHKHGVQCCRHYVPLHLSQGGLRYARYVGDMRTTIKVGDELLRLPLWAGMTWAHVHHVVDGLFGFYGVKPPSYKETLNLFSPAQS